MASCVDGRASTEMSLRKDRRPKGRQQRKDNGRQKTAKRRLSIGGGEMDGWVVDRDDDHHRD